MKTDKERTVEFFESLGVKIQDNGLLLSVYPSQEKFLQYADINFFFNDDGSFLKIESQS